MTEPYRSLHSLTHCFLIATSNVRDPYFHNSVVYLFDYNKKGSMGVIINKPSPLRMEHLFKAIDKESPAQFQDSWLLLGGPMQIDRGFLVHTPIGNWESSLVVNNEVAVTTSRDIIESLLNNNSSIKSLATIGYSAWAAGQLEEELNNNDWIVTPADLSILFDMPYHQRYTAALKASGIKPHSLVAEIGHA